MLYYIREDLLRLSLDLNFIFFLKGIFSRSYVQIIYKSMNGINSTIAKKFAHLVIRTKMVKEPHLSKMKLVKISNVILIPLNLSNMLFPMFPVTEQQYLLSNIP